jgi:hypothetical protein
MFQGIIDKLTHRPQVLYKEVPLTNHRGKAPEFSWGHGGKGPADLAYSILYETCGEVIAKKYFQVFKWDRLVQIDIDKEWGLDCSMVWAYIKGREEYDKKCHLNDF